MSYSSAAALPGSVRGVPWLVWQIPKGLFSIGWSVAAVGELDPPGVWLDHLRASFHPLTHSAGFHGLIGTLICWRERGVKHRELEPASLS